MSPLISPKTENRPKTFVDRCVGVPKHDDLIYDIGMHKGEDTEFYLRKGFCVVAVEANPELVKLCRTRFAASIEQGHLAIVEGAILDPHAIAPGQKTVPFYVSKLTSVWGTVCYDWAKRNERMGDSSTVVQVDVIDLRDVLERHGMPHYMKVDIEGCDMACVHALRHFQERPDYVSLEAEKTGYQNIADQIAALVELGYDRFQAVEQSEICRRQSPPFPSREGKFTPHELEEGSSGLFGSELPRKWKTESQILRQYRRIALGYRLSEEGRMTQWKFPMGRLLRSISRECLKLMTGGPVPGWHDTHAKHRSAVTHDKQITKAT
jgi:FkbM family methyltransferase